MTSALAKSQASDLWDRLIAFAKTLETPLRLAFLAAVQAIRDQLVLRAIVEELAAGNIGAAELMAAGGADAYQALTPAMHDALVSAGSREMGDAATVLRVNLAFDAYNPVTVRYAQDFAGTLIREISQDQLVGIRTILANALRSGQGPAATARDLRLLIGLTQQQQQYVLNYRAALESGDLNVLARALRDARSDAKILRVFQSGEGLAQADIDRLVQRYADRWLIYRSQTIARTESIRALRVGAQAAWQQIVDSGKWDGSTIVQRWYLGPEINANAPCPVCIGIAADNVDGVPLGAQFNGKGGDGPPAHTSCRCLALIGPAD